jgi:hypothetical protein
MCGAARWARRRRALLILLTAVFALLLTCPSQRSFARHVRRPPRASSFAGRVGAVVGMGHSAWAFVEAAVGAQLYTNRGVFATAR